jgi:hypothetical protein
MRPDYCKYFNGFGNSQCDAGVCYREVTPDPHKIGLSLRIPCRSQPDLSWSPKQLVNFENRGKCDKFELPTAEEIAADEEDGIKSGVRMLAAMAAIKQTKPARGSAGVIDCPNCDGRLRFSVSSVNGHIHAKCSTPECVFFME